MQGPGRVIAQKLTDLFTIFGCQKRTSRVGHVLGKPPAEEKAAIESAIDEAVRCTEILLKEDLKQAQNRLHSHKG